MAIPEVWIKAAIEDACECLAYPVDAPEGAAPPYVTFARASTTRDTAATLDNAVPNVLGTFSVSIYADSYIKAKELADDCRESLHNFSGIAEGVTIELSVLNDEVDGQPVYLDGRDRPTYSVDHTYAIHWVE